MKRQQTDRKYRIIANRGICGGRVNIGGHVGFELPPTLCADRHGNVARLLRCGLESMTKWLPLCGATAFRTMLPISIAYHIEEKSAGGFVMATRLGLDIGTNSIGWCLIEDDKRIVALVD